MKADPITSAQNPLIKRVRALRQRKYREREGLCFVEGIRAVEEAVASDATLERLLYAPDRLRSERAMETIRSLEGRGVEITPVSGRVFDTLSDREEGQGVGALVRIPARTLDDLPVTPGALVAALVEPRDPGNIGSVIRTADAAGASAVAVVGTSADPYDPKAVRASMGSLFSVPVAQAAGVDAFLSWAKSRRLRCVATSAHASDSCFDADLTGSVALVLGPERGGLDDNTLRQCDAAVHIPMRGRASSLNLAAAASVLMYEAVRQRSCERP